MGEEGLGKNIIRMGFRLRVEGWWPRPARGLPFKDSPLKGSPRALAYCKMPRYPWRRSIHVCLLIALVLQLALGVTAWPRACNVLPPIAPWNGSVRGTSTARSETYETDEYNQAPKVILKRSKGYTCTTVNTCTVRPVHSSAGVFLQGEDEKLETCKGLRA